MFVKIGRRRTEEYIRETAGEIGIALDGWRVKELRKLLRGILTLRISLCCRLGPSDIYFSGWLKLLGFGVDLSIDFDWDYGEANMSAYIDCPLATADISATKTFAGRKAFRDRAEKD